MSFGAWRVCAGAWATVAVDAGHGRPTAYALPSRKGAFIRSPFRAGVHGQSGAGLRRRCWPLPVKARALRLLRLLLA